MIRLSDRLQYIADQIGDGETMADIGTDHGFLPVFLAESGRCPHVVMADVSPLSLDKARETARRERFSEGQQEDAAPEVSADRGKSDCAPQMDFRAGDGLSVLQPYEVDTVVIAGMGGKLIRDIMAADIALTHSFRKFVLQPRIGQGHLRKWLVDNGFVIVREGVVHEGRHIPEIITAVSMERLSCGGTSDEGASRVDTSHGDSSALALYSADLMKRAEKTLPAAAGSMREACGDDIRWKLPPWMIYADGPLEEFLLRCEMAEKEKLENVRRARKRDMELEARILHDIEYLKFLKDLRKEYNDGKC